MDIGATVSATTACDSCDLIDSSVVATISASTPQRGNPLSRQQPRYLSLPAPMARNAFVVRLPFPRACAIGTQPRPTRCEYLGCLRVGQADRTPWLRAGNLHAIPYAAPPSKEVAFRRPPRPKQQLPLPTKLDCPAAASASNGPERSARKRVDRRTGGQCNLSGSTPFRISGKPAT